MATFKGTIQEFHHFMGPRIRNVINNKTRQPRADRNKICESCGKKSELQSAHVKGRGRRTIIESVLHNYTDTDGSILCSLEDAENEIIKAHEPLSETFKFLCQPCHVEYDSRSSSKVPREPKRKTQMPKDIKFQKIDRIENWSKKPNQINSRIISAYLELERAGPVTLSKLEKYCIDNLGIKTFKGNFASLKTDSGNSHGMVFYQEVSVVI